MKNRTLVAALMALGVLVAASSAMAEPMTLGVDGAFILPLGKWGDATGPMIGPLLRLELPLQPNLVITARAGYLYGFKKSQTSLGGGDVKTGINDIPVWGGAKYYLSGAQEGFYAAGELGLNFVSSSTDFGGGQSNSESKTYVGTNLGAGYKAGDIDARGGLAILDLGHMGDTMGLLLTVGYNFTQF